MKEEEDLDKLFKKGLEDPVNDAAYREADWDAMEQMLDKPKRRAGIIYWLPIIGSVAALVLLFLGWMIFKPKEEKNTKPEQAAVVRPHGADSNNTAAIKKNTGISGGRTEQVADSSKQNILVPANYAKTPGVSGKGQKSKSFFTLSPGADRRDITGNPSKDVAQTQQASVLAVTKMPENVTAPTVVKPAAVSPQTSIIKDSAVMAVNNIVPKDTIVNNQPAKTIASTVKGSKDNKQPKLGGGPRMALSVLASSDFNGVSSFQQSRIGGNFGLLFSIGVSKKLTLSTGAMYSIKPYSSNIADYHTSYQFPTQPSSVDVNCRMIDIPLNLNYQVYHKGVNKFSVGSGLSSYIILREDYTFNYVNPYANGPAGYSVINKNRNFFGVLNLDVSYERQLNSKVGVTLQPYLKLPLSNIGQGQARLQTAGVAVGFNWNLNSSSKP